MVRSRRGISGAAWLLVGLLLSAPISRAQKPTELPIEQRPYRIRVWLGSEPSVRLSSEERGRLIASWQEFVVRFVGPAWEVQIESTAGPLLGQTVDRLTVEGVSSLAEDADKCWFLQVGAAPTGSGWQLSGREYDAATRQLGSIHRLPARHRRDAARSLFQLSLRVFAPLAEIVRTTDDVKLKVQASALTAADPIGVVVGEGTVFRSFWILLSADGTVKGVRPINYTYLRVSSTESSPFPVDVVSGLRRPLPQQVAGRYRLMALGSRAASVPTRLRFYVVRKEDNSRLPYPGAVLMASTFPDGTPRVVGTTGREGEISLPPDFADGLVKLQLLGGGVEPLREIPILPGETEEEIALPVEPKPDAVALQYRLMAIQDEIVDLIARRGQLEARLEARAGGQQWDEVKALLDEYLKLPPRSRFEQRVAALKEEAERKQAEQKVPILTQTALRDLSEVDALIQRYLDDSTYQAYDDAYRRSLEQAADASGANRKAAPGTGPPSPPSPVGKEAAPAPKAQPPTPQPVAPGPAPAVGGANQVPF